MSVRRRAMGRAEDAARRAVGRDPTDEPRLKFLSSNGEPAAATPDQISGEETDMTDGTGLYTIEELAQQEFDRLVEAREEDLAWEKAEAADAEEDADGPLNSLWEIGSPSSLWEAGSPSGLWEAGSPSGLWEAGSPSGLWEAGSPSNLWESGL